MHTYICVYKVNKLAISPFYLFFISFTLNFIPIKISVPIKKLIPNFTTKNQLVVNISLM